MSPEVLTTIVTGAGVILTVVVSSIFNVKRINVELNQLKQQNRMAYAAQILEKRHACYPILYKVIISFINEIRAKDVKREDLITLYKKLTSWDQSYSIFLSARSQFIFFKLLKIIRTTVNSTHGNPKWADRMQIMEEIRRMELALKSDIGVFIMDFTGAPEGFFQDYTSLFEETQKEETTFKPSNVINKENDQSEEEVGERQEGTIDE